VASVPASWVRHSRDYVLEELAVFAVQCAARPAAEIYPGSNLASAEYLVGRDLPSAIAPLGGRPAFYAGGFLPDQSRTDAAAAAGGFGKRAGEVMPADAFCRTS
jgi:hypothetical protein